MEIVEYINAVSIKVKFESGNIKTARYSNFKIGKVKDELAKSVYGVGIFGVGNYNIKNNLKEYTTWRGMIARCYNFEFHKMQYSYVGCTVCDEWHNFQNFAKWYEENYYIVDDLKMDLDKDILVKGNKIYSPETCIFVPRRINALFIKNNFKRGELPIGVCYMDNRYVASFSKPKGAMYLGCYETQEEAFCVYKEAKEKYIKSVAEEYRYRIPHNIYIAMCNYVIEITD